MNPKNLLRSLALFALLTAPLLHADAGKKVKISGHLVDVSCATEQKDDPNYMRTQHSKECFQMPKCVKSGFAVLTSDDRVLKFDAAGNELAKKLIAASDKSKDWRIKVRGKMDGELLHVTRLQLER